MHTLLFGGTFDPIHHGHLLTARAALEALNADRVLLMPAALSPHKNATAAAPQHRLAMCQLAAGVDERFWVSDMELHRPAPSYTIDTVESLLTQPTFHSSHNTLTLLIGADQLPRLHTWHRVAELLQKVRVAVLNRSGAPLDLAHVAQKIPTADLTRITALNTPFVDISATDIRARAAAGLSLHWLVPGSVASHILEHRIYEPDSC